MLATSAPEVIAILAKVCLSLWGCRSGTLYFAENFFRNSTREMLVVVSLDAQKRPVAAEVVSVGLLSSCMVGIPEVFRHAILVCADALLCFHNHPSSSLTPSTEDIRVTKRLKEAGELLGIRLLDHIIIGGDGSYVSLNEKGYL